MTLWIVSFFGRWEKKATETIGGGPLIMNWIAASTSLPKAPRQTAWCLLKECSCTGLN